MAGIILLNMEIFKDIQGYEGLYQISNRGYVKSVARTVIHSNGNKYVVPEKVLKNGNNKIGYLTVSLWKNNIGKTHFIHRLIAEYFIHNPENKKTVNHINGIRADNRVENLEWSTYSENNLHSYRILGKKGAKAKAIKCSNGNEYESIRQAARDLNTDKTNITRVLSGTTKHFRNLSFKYA